MKHSKFTKFLSVFMAMIMALGTFGCLSASAATTCKVSLRVEGISGNLFESPKFLSYTVDSGSSLKSLIDSKLTGVKYAEDNATLKTVCGESKESTSSWQFAVDGDIQAVTVDKYIIKGNCDIVIFNGTSDCVYPIVDTANITSSGYITIKGKNVKGEITPIANAPVVWGADGTTITFTTDKNGKIYFENESHRGAGSHSIQINSKNESGVPNVVRLAPNTSITIEKVVQNNNPVSFIQNLYENLYDILMGIWDGWMFYLDAFIKIVKSIIEKLPTD